MLKNSPCENSHKQTERKLLETDLSLPAPARQSSDFAEIRFYALSPKFSSSVAANVKRDTSLCAAVKSVADDDLTGVD
jgi:hypothetical protein